MAQYVIRNKAIQLLRDKFLKDHLKYKYVVMIRSDITLASSIWAQILVAGNHSNHTNENIVWLPKYEMLSLITPNDRIMIMTASAFLDYSDKGFLQKVFTYIDTNSSIFGEGIHGFMLRNSTVIPFPICYGVARRFDCSWTHYGNEECKELGLTPPAEKFRHAFFSDRNFKTCIREKHLW